MTLKEYEKLREESRKVLARTELRKAEMDEELENMQQLSSKKSNDEIFAKLVRALLMVPSRFFFSFGFVINRTEFYCRVLIRISAKKMLTRRRKLRRYVLLCFSNSLLSGLYKLNFRK